MDLSVPLDTVKDEQEQNKNSDLLHPLLGTIGAHHAVRQHSPAQLS